MMRIALTMLVGDRAKFLGLTFGLAFASLLITQQAAIFRGVMTLVYGHITDSPQADLWVGDPGIPDFDTNDMLHERELDNVRAINGVDWAVPLARRMLMARQADNQLQPVMIMGIDDATLIGGPLPSAMVVGTVDDLRQPSSMIIDQHAAETKLRIAIPGGSRAMTIGDSLQISGSPIRVVGICRSTLSLMLLPTIYMRRSQVVDLDAATDRSFNFILAGLAQGADPAAICAAITTATGLKPRTQQEFSDHVYEYFLTKTGIPINFGIAVLLGFIVGAAIAGQTFSQYVTDNRRTFAALKAMGLRNRSLARILVMQALAVGVVGFGLGVGGATVFGLSLRGTDLSFRLEPQLLLLAVTVVLALSLGAALASLRSVLRLDPALVFRS